MVTDGGFEVAFHGEYRHLIENERIVCTEVYEGMPEGEALNTMTFTEVAGRTTLPSSCSTRARSTVTHTSTPAWRAACKGDGSPGTGGDLAHLAPRRAACMPDQGGSRTGLSSERSSGRGQLAGDHWMPAWCRPNGSRISWGRLTRRSEVYGPPRHRRSGCRTSGCPRAPAQAVEHTGVGRIRAVDNDRHPPAKAGAPRERERGEDVGVGGGERDASIRARTIPLDPARRVRVSRRAREQ
ncbi:MAG: SRPBCC domain-containing protein [Gemmatimonadales bacterium]